MPAKKQPLHIIKAKRAERQRVYRAAHPEKVREWERNWRAAHPDRTANQLYRSKYGMTLADKERLFAAQGFRCKICRSSTTGSRGWHTDHVKGSKPPIIRGILCSRCNPALGWFKHDPELLLAAANYLKGLLVGS
jgi:hypothetical protein